MTPWNLTTFMLVSLRKCSGSGCQNSLLPFQDCNIAEPSKGGLFPLLQCPSSEWTRGGAGWGETSGVHVLWGQSLERCVDGFQLVVMNRKRRAPCTASGLESMPVLVGRQPSLRREASTGCAFQERRRRGGLPAAPSMTVPEQQTGSTRNAGKPLLIAVLWVSVLSSVILADWRAPWWATPSAWGPVC